MKKTAILPLLLLALPAPAAAATANDKPYCECVPGAVQSTSGPGGCTLRRHCLGVSGTCTESTKLEIDDDGTITQIPLKGLWSAWVESCDRPVVGNTLGGELTLEQLLILEESLSLEER